jgi:hypothetical protein
MLVLVVFVVLDCFPRRGRSRDRGRRRPRARSGKIPQLLNRSRRRRRARLLSSQGQIEDDNDHEHDQEKSRGFLIVLVVVVVLDCFPRRGRPRTTTSTIDDLEHHVHKDPLGQLSLVPIPLHQLENITFGITEKYEPAAGDNRIKINHPIWFDAVPA